MSSPLFVLRTRVRRPAYEPDTLEKLLILARPFVVGAARRGSPLRRLSTVEITIISDRAIAQVHARFFGDPTPTDVISFDYGEILVGAGVVARQAREYGEPLAREALRCMVHGLLHLGGWRDDTARRRAGMARRQEAILAAVCGLAESAAAVYLAAEEPLR